MIAELFTYFTTPCPAYVRRMGYLYEAIAITGRYRRHEMHWRLHLENSRRHVMTAAEHCRGRSRVVILGSGLLLDVPLAALSAIFREVVLVDVVFLNGTRKSVKGYGNVRLIRQDVTGTAEQMYRNVCDGKVELPDPRPFFPCADGEDILVISMNILSQLAVIPGGFALRIIPDMSGKTIEAWKKRIVESHYAALQDLPCPACMITDHSFTERDHKGNVVEQGSTVSGLALPEPADEWTWNIAPRGEVSRSLSRELRVGVWKIR